MSQSERIKIGTRGFHAQVKDGCVDIRLFQRDFVKHDTLHATWRGINIAKEEWFDLVSAMPTVTGCIESCTQQHAEPSLFIPLGSKGIHAMVNIYNGVLLVQLGVYLRSFYDPDKLFPTNQGAALKTEEWKDLCENAKRLSDMLAT